MTTETSTVERPTMACSDPAGCCMHIGAVVRHRQRQDRGIVVASHGQGDAPRSPVAVYSNDACVRLRGGEQLWTNMHDDWEPVPDQEQTFEERVRSRWLTWEPWRDPGDEHEDDDRVFYALQGLLTPDEQADMFDGSGDCDWPTSYFELVTQIACVVDQRQQSGAPEVRP